MTGYLERVDLLMGHGGILKKETSTWILLQYADVTFLISENRYNTPLQSIGIFATY